MLLDNFRHRKCADCGRGTLVGNTRKLPAEKLHEVFLWDDREFVHRLFLHMVDHNHFRAGFLRCLHKPLEKIKLVEKPSRQGVLVNGQLKHAALQVTQDSRVKRTEKARRHLIYLKNVKKPPPFNVHVDLEQKSC